MRLKGGKRPPPFLLAIWGSGGRRFKSDHPDHRREKPLFLMAIIENNGKWGAEMLPLISKHLICKVVSCEVLSRSPIPIACRIFHR